MNGREQEIHIYNEADIDGNSEGNFHEEARQYIAIVSICCMQGH